MNDSLKKSIAKAYQALYHDVGALMFFLTPCHDNAIADKWNQETLRALELIMQDVVIIRAFRDGVDLPAILDSECPDD